jgi:hypothetical protein
MENILMEMEPKTRSLREVNTNGSSLRVWVMKKFRMMIKKIGEFQLLGMDLGLDR